MQKVVDGVIDKVGKKFESADPDLASIEAYATAAAQSAIWAEESGDPVFMGAAGGFQLNVTADVSARGVTWISCEEAEKIACPAPKWVPILGWACGYAHQTICKLPGAPKQVPITIDLEANADVIGRYRWSLDATGLLGVDPLLVHVRSAKDDLHVYGFATASPDPIDKAIVDGLSSGVPAGIADAARSKQLAEIPTIIRRPDGGFDPGPPVRCNEPRDCATALAYVDPTRGAEGTLELAILAALVVAPELRPSEANLRAIINDPSEWRCEPVGEPPPRFQRPPGTDIGTPPATDKTCRMLVGGQRVNTYPDAVEVVIREAGEWPVRRETLLEALLILADRVNHTNLRAELMCDAPEHGERSIRAFVGKSSKIPYD